MRIAIVTAEYPPLEGGVGDFTRQLGLALIAQGHELHILTSLDEKPCTTQEVGIIIHREIGDWGWVCHSRLTHWIQKLAPEIVNIQYQAASYQMRGGINLYPRWQRRNLEVPLVTTFHDLLPPYLFPKAGPLRQWAVWQMARYCDGVIVTNDEDYTTLTQSLAAGERRPQTRLIHIGSNIAPSPPPDYDRRTWRRHHRLQDDALLVGFFGFLNASKGVETLLNALAQLVETGVHAHLVFIGGRTGSSDITNFTYADEIDALIAALGLQERVLRTGFTTPTEVSAALLAADICVLPYRDGASLRRGTLHACLAHGLPIITTVPRAPIPALQDGENLLLAPSQDPAALAEAILHLWHEPDLRLHLGQQAAALAAEFSWERIAAHTAELFRQLAPKKAG